MALSQAQIAERQKYRKRVDNLLARVLFHFMRLAFVFFFFKLNTPSSICADI
jgi:hypothetical protein